MNGETQNFAYAEAFGEPFKVFLFRRTIMGLFTKLFGKKNNSNDEVSKIAEMFEDNSNELYGLPEGYKPGEAADTSDEEKAKVARVLAQLDADIPAKMRIRLKPVREHTSVFDSKLGGIPYLPKGYDYPVVNTGEHFGKPLRFLAQLNFAKLPHIEGFPQSGILQFYAGCDGDDLIGMDFENGFNQNGFRVIYHGEIIEDERQLYSAKDMPSFDMDDCAFPFRGEFRLDASEPEMQAVIASDYHFDKAAVAAYNKVFGTQYDSVFGTADKNCIYHHDKDLCDLLYEMRSISGSAIGGYPYFTQDDPRGYGEEAGKCDILLFQLDSEGSGADEIMWGDCGVGNFFISAEDLAALDFTKVLYNWDCC